MQRIERYGVIALVFLLVTVAAVSFWGEDKQSVSSNTKTARIEGPSSPATEAVTEPARERPRRPRNGRAQNRGDSHATAPLSQSRPQERPRSRPRTETVSVDPLPVDPLPSDPLAEGPAESAPAKASGRGDMRMEGAPLDDDELEFAWSVDPIQGRPGRGGPRGESERAERNTAVSPPRGATPAPASAQEGFIWYEVQPHETLSEIAERSLGSSGRWREIQVLNGGLAPESLRSGTKIKLPSGALASLSEPSAGASPQRASSASGARTYIVKSGDTLSRIAERELGGLSRMSEIIALNPELNPDVVVLGTPIQLPASRAPRRPRAIAQADPAPQHQRTEGPRVR